MRWGSGTSSGSPRPAVCRHPSPYLYPHRSHTAAVTRVLICSIGTAAGWLDRAAAGGWPGRGDGRVHPGAGGRRGRDGNPRAVGAPVGRRLPQARRARARGAQPPTQPVDAVLRRQQRTHPSCSLQPSGLCHLIRGTVELRASRTIPSGASPADPCRARNENFSQSVAWTGSIGKTAPCRWNRLQASRSRGWAPS